MQRQTVNLAQLPIGPVENLGQFDPDYGETNVVLATLQARVAAAFRRLPFIGIVLCSTSFVSSRMEYDKLQ